MSSDGEFDEAPEYSEESQDQDYKDEVAEELADLQEDDSDEDPDYDPDSPPPSDEEPEEDDEDDDTSEEPARDWDFVKITAMDPVFEELVQIQPFPDCQSISARLTCFEALIRQRMHDKPESRRHFLRLISTCKDFWEHIGEEMSDHIVDCLRVMKKLNSRMNAGK